MEHAVMRPITDFEVYTAEPGDGYYRIAGNIAPWTRGTPAGGAFAQALGNLNGWADVHPGMAILVDPALIPAEPPAVRDVIQHPYPSDHYWNMPLGDQAVLEPCRMTAPAVFRAERDCLFIDPHATRYTVFKHTGAWNSTPRCEQTTAEPLTNLGAWNPLPMDVFAMGGDWDDNNQVAAFLTVDDDGDIRRVETQPFVFCDGLAYSQYTRPSYQGGYIDHRAVMPAEGPNGEGIESGGVGGAHGGSGIEGFGGSVRLRHIADRRIDTATKCVVNTAYWLSPVDHAIPRWPATRVDAGHGNYGTARPAGTGTAPTGMRMGALLAIPADFNIDGLSTPAGRMIGEAWRTYGTYICDGAQAHNGFYLGVEYGPQGDVETAFAAEFGHSFRQRDVDRPTGLDLAFFDDMKNLITALCLVADNSSKNIGGAGRRLAPMTSPL